MFKKKKDDVTAIVDRILHSFHIDTFDTFDTLQGFHKKLQEHDF